MWDAFLGLKPQALCLRAFGAFGAREPRVVTYGQNPRPSRFSRKRRARAVTLRLEGLREPFFP
ncbi:MAG: hypothetical protein QOH06_4811 [Acidobacteriota bacterium]|jgi:hypothetical protein|nr:hypothetical protein [Acidobacteriota bacterium]